MLKFHIEITAENPLDALADICDLGSFLMASPDIYDRCRERCRAESVPTQTSVLQVSNPQPVPAPVTESKPEPAPVKEQFPTLEEVTAAAKTAARNHGNKAVRDILSKLSAASISTLPQTAYNDFLKELRRLDNA